MINVTDADFQKVLSFLKKEGQAGANKTFIISGTKLIIRTVDITSRQMDIELSDTAYNFMPTVTKTERIL